MLPPSGSIVVKKVNNNNDFIEDILTCDDINAVSITGAQTITGQKTFDQPVILNTEPSLSGHAATKKYVDDLVSSGTLDILGVIKFDANTTATTISATNTYYKVAGTNSTAYTSVNMDSSTNNKIISLNTDTERFKLHVTGSLSCSTANQTIKIAAYKNGTTKICETELRIVTANFGNPFALCDVLDLSLNDYIEVFVANETATRDVIMEYMQFIVRAI